MSRIDQRQYLKTIAETIPDGLLIINRDGRIVSVNPVMEMMTGYRREYLVGKNCRILEGDLTKADIQDANCAVFRETKIRNARCVLRKKDGTPLHVVKNASVLRNADGIVVAGVEIFTDLSEILKKESVIAELRKRLGHLHGFYGLVGVSKVMQRIFDLISSAAYSDEPMLIRGENGTGKGLAAQAIHDAGPRNEAAYIRLNCAALHEMILENELFSVNGLGRLAADSGGTIFLDEIDGMPLTIQARLARALEANGGEGTADGEAVLRNARIISATDKDMEGMVRSGRFREDLYDHIRVIPVRMPPLRERREDIPPMVNAFIKQVRLKTGKPVTGMDGEAIERLGAYHWPGNVRELFNAIEYAFVLCPKGIITADNLPRTILDADKAIASAPETPVEKRKSRHDDPTDEKKRLLDALERAGGNKSEAARLMGISRVSLYKKLKKHDVRVDKRVAG